MVSGVKLLNLEAMCRRQGLDTQHIDKTLTYEENKNKLGLTSLNEEMCAEIGTIEWYEKELQKKNREIKNLRKFIKRYIV